MHSPLLGFNNNVRHRGRLFHIQTEDSGVRHPHVITHLFMDGGRILKTVKTSYAEHLGTERLAQRVRDLMKQQHKTMFIALRDGQFDDVVEGSSPTSQRSVAAPDPPPVALASVLDGAAEAAAEHTPGPDRPLVDVTAVVATDAVTPSPAPHHRPLARREAPELFSGATTDAADINVVAHSAVVTSSKDRPSSGRYAISRPAALFTTAKAADANASIFGEDLISEQSLDDVILSYLADDLGAASPKK